MLYKISELKLDKLKRFSFLNSNFLILLKKIVFELNDDIRSTLIYSNNIY